MNESVELRVRVDTPGKPCRTVRTSVPPQLDPATTTLLTLEVGSVYARGTVTVPLEVLLHQLQRVWVE